VKYNAAQPFIGIKYTPPTTPPTVGTLGITAESVIDINNLMITYTITHKHTVQHQAIPKIFESVDTYKSNPHYDMYILTCPDVRFTNSQANMGIQLLRGKLLDYNARRDASVIYDFINKIVIDNYDNFARVGTTSATNTGFARMSGGAIDIEYQFGKISSFIKNTTAIVSEFNVYSMFGEIYYKNKEAIGIKLFEHIFRAIQGTSSTMFALILNYFHKTGISMNGLYNSILYPSILYNAAVFRYSAGAIANVINTEWSSVIGNEMDADKGNYTKQLYLTISKYMKSIKDSSDMFIFDLAVNPFYQICYGPRVSDMTYQSFVKSYNNFMAGNEKYGSLVLSNQFSMPSIANNFLSKMCELTFDYGKSMSAQPDALTYLIHTPFMNYLRKLDVQMTFMHILFALMKQTAGYQIDVDYDVPYFNITNPDAFSSI
jgi:hypothetical protein